MSQLALTTEIDMMSAKLEETKEASRYNRGPVNDALQIVIPMLQDQLKIMIKIVDALVEEEPETPTEDLEALQDASLNTVTGGRDARLPRSAE